MKTETKQKLIPVLKAVSALLEKCGGPGGTPGPCPTGNHAGGGKGEPPQDHKVKSKIDHTFKDTNNISHTVKAGNSMIFGGEPGKQRAISYMHPIRGRISAKVHNETAAAVYGAIQS